MRVYLIIQLLKLKMGFGAMLNIGCVIQIEHFISILKSMGISTTDKDKEDDEEDAEEYFFENMEEIMDEFNKIMKKNNLPFVIYYIWPDDDHLNWKFFGLKYKHIQINTFHGWGNPFCKTEYDWLLKNGPQIEEQFLKTMKFLGQEGKYKLNIYSSYD